MRIYKTPLLLIALLFIFSKSMAQVSLGVEIIPYSFFMGNGNGISAQINKLYKSNVGFQVKVGAIHYNWYGKRREYYTDLEGNPLYDFSTNVDVFTAQPYPLGGVVSEYDFKLFEESGIKHLVPFSDFRRNIYCGVSFLYKKEWKYFGIQNQIGPQFGQSEYELTVVGFSGTIINELNGQSEEMWVQLEFEGRYLYLGLEETLFIYYPLKKNFDIGITTGIQYIFDKKFREDMKAFYIGLAVGVKI